MFRWIKRIVLIVLVLTVGLFLHYVLPRHDVVRITDTETRLQSFSAWNRMFYAQEDAGIVEGTARDVRFISAVRPNDRVIVYRNEDTGWIWPPYFKFDSSNLQAQAADLRSDRAAPQWVVVTKYGWRIPFLSVYPNAVGIRAVDGPEVRIVPWFNIVFFILLALFLLLIWRMIAQFRERTVDPFIDRVDDHTDAAAARAKGLWGRLTGRAGGRKPPPPGE